MRIENHVAARLDGLEGGRKLQELFFPLSGLFATVREAHEHERFARDTLSSINSKLGRIRDSVSYGSRVRFGPDGQTSVLTVDEFLADDRVYQTLAHDHARWARECDQWSARVAELQSQIEPLAKLFNRAHQYVENLPAHVSLRPRPRVAVVKGPMAAVEKARAELAALKADKHEVESAPVAAAELKAILARHVAAIASRGEPDLETFLHTGDTTHIRLPERDAIFGAVMSMAAGVGQGSASGRLPDAIALLAWLDPERFTDRLHAALDELTDGEAGITEEERHRRLADLDARVLAVQHIEEAATVVALAAGHTCTRRPDLDPRAFLELADDMPAPAN